MPNVSARSTSASVTRRGGMVNNSYGPNSRCRTRRSRLAPSRVQIPAPLPRIYLQPRHAVFSLFAYWAHSVSSLSTRSKTATEACLQDRRPSYQTLCRTIVSTIATNVSARAAAHHCVLSIIRLPANRRCKHRKQHNKRINLINYTVRCAIARIAMRAQTNYVSVKSQR
jgi:hypothetical protein